MDSIIVIAHRGGLFYRPENSIAAFSHCVSMGGKWAECDVRLSRDGIPILFHDDSLTLPSGTDRGTREIDCEDLANIDIGGGESIPTLQQLLEKFGRTLYIDLELKELDSVEPVIQIVRRMDLADRVILSSFIPEALQVARDIAPEISRGFLVDRLTGRIVGPTSAVKAANMFSCEYFLPHYTALSQEWIKAARNTGMKVIPWTVNRIEDGKRLIEMGVDGLITDRIDLFSGPKYSLK